MTADQAVEQLEALKNQDPESSHLRADEILCELLATLDCADVVEAFNGVRKWYA